MEQAFLASLLTSKYPSIINIYYTYSIALYVLVIQVLFRYFLNIVSVPAFMTFLGCAFLLSNSAWFYFPQIPLKPLYSLLLCPQHNSSTDKTAVLQHKRPRLNPDLGCCPCGVGTFSLRPRGFILVIWFPPTYQRPVGLPVTSILYYGNQNCTPYLM